MESILLSFLVPVNQTCNLQEREQYFQCTNPGRALAKGAGPMPGVRLPTQDTLLPLCYGEDPEALRAGGVHDCTATAAELGCECRLCDVVSPSTASPPMVQAPPFPSLVRSNTGQASTQEESRAEKWGPFWLHVTHHFACKPLHSPPRL